MSSSLNNESDVSLDSKDEQLVQQSYKPDCNEPTHSPPSSSPVVKMEREDVKPSKPSFSRKRSHEDISTALQPQKTDPETAVEETKPTSANEQQTGKKSQDSNGAMASAAAHTMPPPTTPGAMAPPSIKPQRSRQGSETATHSGKTANGAGGPYETQHQTDTSDEDPTSDDIKMCDTPATGEPRDPIEDFHWQDLEQRYHDKINELCTEEHQIMMEFDSLCNVRFPPSYRL